MRFQALEIKSGETAKTALGDITLKKLVAQSQGAERDVALLETGEQNQRVKLGDFFEFSAQSFALVKPVNSHSDAILFTPNGTRFLQPDLCIDPKMKNQNAAYNIWYLLQEKYLGTKSPVNLQRTGVPANINALCTEIEDKFSFVHLEIQELKRLLTEKGVTSKAIFLPNKLLLEQTTTYRKKILFYYRICIRS